VAGILGFSKGFVAPPLGGRALQDPPTDRTGQGAAPSTA